MQGLTAGYWHRNGLDLYRYVKGKPVRTGGGSLDELTPLRGALQRIVLIIGRDRLLHIRKRYPPAPKEKLAKAVRLELGELFPFSRPDFYCRVNSSSSAYTELDIWAWESEPYSLLRNVLPFHYAIPEEAAFSSSTAEIFLWTWKDVTHLLAVSERRFLGAASHPADAFTEEDAERFLNSLEAYGAEMHRMRVYGILPVTVRERPALFVENVPDRGYSPCLDNIPSMNLREFRCKRELRIPAYPGLLFRMAIYGVLGCGLVLYLNMRDHERASQALQEISRQMDRRIQLAESRQGIQAIDYSAVQKELSDRLNARQSPLSVLDMLARTLPEDCYISSVQLNENNVEVLIISKEPLAALKALAEEKGIRNIQLKGPLNMEGKTGEYSFVVTIELAG
ncbi:MAG: hypothetical protein A4E70_02318 [Syntrophus sp. PtaU1.Bin005]|jgi:Tfp pilus assembly protein PilN|uniref:hypothetical protein n=1 Tax=Syntrophus TaxID=43773 RepID=UPI0009D5CD0B|nr:MAG: hypothetical protein A4E69_00820 [Syntrophus sp. PtaB.Bin138]OPY78781.1 MAG: hypothetical protein A4E70_02318 [Syntrophus sp. PtaU1.Bin005]